MSKALLFLGMTERKIGIEITNKSESKKLFEQADILLDKNNIPPNGITREIQAQTVAHALQKMIRNDVYFSVTTLEKCANVCGIIISKERMNVYDTIHCMNWNEMIPEYRLMIISMILDEFRGILNADYSIVKV